MKKNEDKSRMLNIVGFLLSSTSILALLVEMYGIMRASFFTKYFFLPAMLLLAILALYARKKGYKDFWTRTVVGFVAGLLATIAYDLGRIPFLLAGTNLYKAIFKFGPLIVSEFQELMPRFVIDLLGWTYHFSNGITFGMMLIYVIARPKLWQAIAWGVVLEIAMLLTPYPQTFGIILSLPFIAGSFFGHFIFGIVLGISINKLWKKF